MSTLYKRQYAEMWISDRLWNSSRPPWSEKDWNPLTEMVKASVPNEKRFAERTQVSQLLVPLVRVRTQISTVFYWSSGRDAMLPANKVIASLNTFPLRPSVSAFCSGPSSQHSGTDSFPFSKGEQKLLWKNELKIQSTHESCSVSLWIMPQARHCWWQKNGTSGIYLGVSHPKVTGSL